MVSQCLVSDNLRAIGMWLRQHARRTEPLSSSQEVRGLGELYPCRLCCSVQMTRSGGYPNPIDYCNTVLVKVGAYVDGAYLIRRTLTNLTATNNLQMST